MTQSPSLPAQGGSYVRGKKGELKCIAQTKPQSATSSEGKTPSKEA